jgi:hypothetical protein
MLDGSPPLLEFYFYFTWLLLCNVKIPQTTTRSGSQKLKSYSSPNNSHPRGTSTIHTFPEDSRPLGPLLSRHMGTSQRSFSLLL